MAYCSLNDLYQICPETDIIQLTDDESLGEVVTSIVEDCIEYADTLINSYLSGKYTVPLSTVPDLVKQLSIDLSVFRLYSRRLSLQMPEGLTARYNEAIRLLRDIQAGRMDLPDANTEEVLSGDGFYRTNKTSDNRVFNSTLLDTF